MPTTELTYEQNIAVAKEDAEACNCGKESDLGNANDNDSKISVVNDIDDIGDASGLTVQGD